MTATPTNRHWSLLRFGRYRGHTLPEVVFLGLGWFCWACRERIFRDDLAEEAGEIASKVCRIAVPPSGSTPRLVAYILNSRCRLKEIRVIPHYDRQYVRADCHEAFNLGAIHLLAQGDDYVVGQAMAVMFETVIGNPNPMITREFAEEFFGDESRFLPEKA